MTPRCATLCCAAALALPAAASADKEPDGVAQPLETRHTRLYQQFKDRP